MKKQGIDRRIQRTAQALQDALQASILEKGYEATTVQDIIDRANVGRSTFYAHFQDKEDLLLYQFETLWHEFEERLASKPFVEGDWWNFSLIMFRHAQSYLDVYKAVVGKRSQHLMEAHIHKHLATVIKGYLVQYWSAEHTRQMPLDVMVDYLVKSLMSLVIWWLNNDLPVSAEEMDRMYRQLTQPGVDAILRSPQ